MVETEAAEVAMKSGAVASGLGDTTVQRTVATLRISNRSTRKPDSGCGTEARRLARAGLRGATADACLKRCITALPLPEGEVPDWNNPRFVQRDGGLMVNEDDTTFVTFPDGAGGKDQTYMFPVWMSDENIKAKANSHRLPQRLVYRAFFDMDGGSGDPVFFMNRMLKPAEMTAHATEGRVIDIELPWLDGKRAHLLLRPPGVSESDITVYCIKHIVMPRIEDRRVAIGAKPGDPRHRATIWQDGKADGLDGLNRCAALLSAADVDSGKGTAGRSAEGQEADASPCFRAAKAGIKAMRRRRRAATAVAAAASEAKIVEGGLSMHSFCTPVEDIANTPISKAFDLGLRDNGVNLTGPRREFLQLLNDLPEVLSSACSSSNVKMGGKNVGSYPYNLQRFYTGVAQFKELDQTGVDALLNLVPLCFEEFWNTGELSTQFLNNVKFPDDLYEGGDRNRSDLAEHRQYAKWWNHRQVLEKRTARTEQRDLASAQLASRRVSRALVINTQLEEGNTLLARLRGAPFNGSFENFPAADKSGDQCKKMMKALGEKLSRNGKALKVGELREAIEAKLSSERAVGPVAPDPAAQVAEALAIVAAAAVEAVDEDPDV